MFFNVSVYFFANKKKKNYYNFIFDRLIRNNMFSKVMAISKKLDDLKQKEKEIEDFYDPKSKSKNKKHHHFSDLNQDYKEDLNNYGFKKKNIL